MTRDELRDELRYLSQTLIDLENNEENRYKFFTKALNLLKEGMASGAINDYELICDKRNNTQEVIDDGRFVCDVKYSSEGMNYTLGLVVANQGVDSTELPVEEYL